MKSEQKDTVSIATTALRVDTVHTFSEVKRRLTRQYCLENYGINSERLDSPRMIVVHYTVIPSLEPTLALFKRDHISSDRDYIKDFSSLNVGIHYVIDKNGAIYNLLPDSLVARHLIGFNHVALGIENVAADSTELTDAQLSSNVRLIHLLTQRHRSIRYLIGHREYNVKQLPHYALFRSNNPKYIPYEKTDPGLEFMQLIRDRLSSMYGLALEK